MNVTRHRGPHPDVLQQSFGAERGDAYITIRHDADESIIAVHDQQTADIVLPHLSDGIRQGIVGPASDHVTTHELPGVHFCSPCHETSSSSHARRQNGT
jgi:hypothetical protein